VIKCKNRFGVWHLVHTFAGNMRRSKLPPKGKSHASQIVIVIILTACPRWTSAAPRIRFATHRNVRGSDLCAQVTSPNGGRSALGLSFGGDRITGDRPAALAGFLPSKDRFLQIAAFKGVMVSNGYYVDGPEWIDSSPEAEAIACGPRHRRYSNPAARLGHP
jgi:hypothetical protein